MQTAVQVRKRGQQAPAFYVVASTTAPIIGLKSSQELNLVKLIHNIEAPIQTD